MTGSLDPPSVSPTRPARRPGIRPGATRPALLGSLLLVLAALIVLVIAAPPVRAAVVASGGARTSFADAILPSSPAADAGSGALRGVTTTGDEPHAMVHVAVSPSHPLRPGWGWVVLGLICFAVVLGLAWPDHRDRR